MLKWSLWVGLDERKLDLEEHLFLRHGGKIVFLGRFVAVLKRTERPSASSRRT